MYISFGNFDIKFFKSLIEMRYLQVYSCDIYFKCIQSNNFLQCEVAGHLHVKSSLSKLSVDFNIFFQTGKLDGVITWP